MVLLNERGEVAECTSANIFVAQAGRVWTPPLSDGCLPSGTEHPGLVNPRSENYGNYAGTSSDCGQDSRCRMYDEKINDEGRKPFPKSSVGPGRRGRWSSFRMEDITARLAIQRAIIVRLGAFWAQHSRDSITDGRATRATSL